MSKLLGCMLVGTLMAGAAQAEIVTLDYTAVVTQTLFRDTETAERSVNRILLPDGSALSRTQTVRGTFTFDTATPLTLTAGTPTQPALATGQMQVVSGTGLNTASLRVNETGYALARGRGEGPYAIGFTVADSQPGSGADRFEVLLGTISDTATEDIALKLSQANGSLWSSTAFPTRFNLDALSSATLSYTYYEPISSRIHRWSSFDAKVTGLTQRITPVPEPTTYLMLGVGLLAVGAAARRRKA